MYRSFANEKYFCSSFQLLKSWNEILEFQVSTPSQLTPTLTSKYKKLFVAQATAWTDISENLATKNL